MVSERFPTGLKDFDSWTGGGFPSGNYLVLGPPKVGKTVFVNQVAYLSASANRPVVYVTLDASPASIRARMLEFGWDVEDLVKKNIFQFVDCFTLWYARHPINHDDEFSVESLTNISKLLSVIVSAHDKVGHRGITIFSSLSTLLEHAGFQRAYSLMTGLKAITEEEKNLGFTVLTSGMHSEKEINAFKHIVDGIIEMQHKAENGFTRRVRILGLGARLEYLDWRKFTITKDGISLHTDKQDAKHTNPTQKEKGVKPH